MKYGKVSENRKGVTVPVPYNGNVQAEVEEDEHLVELVDSQGSSGEEDEDAEDETEESDGSLSDVYSE